MIRQAWRVVSDRNGHLFLDHASLKLSQIQIRAVEASLQRGSTTTKLVSPDPSGAVASLVPARGLAEAHDDAPANMRH